MSTRGRRLCDVLAQSYDCSINRNMESISLSSFTPSLYPVSNHNLRLRMLLSVAVRLKPPTPRRNSSILRASDEAVKTNPPIKCCWYCSCDCVRTTGLLRELHSASVRYYCRSYLTELSLTFPRNLLPRSMYRLHAPPPNILLRYIFYSLYGYF